MPATQFFWLAFQVANPARNLRLSAGLALPETEVVDLVSGLRGYVAQHLPTWEAALTSGRASNVAQLQNINALRQALESSAEGAKLSRTPDYTGISSAPACSRKA